MSGDGAKDASELGRGLNDLEPVDSLGKIRRDEGQLIVTFGRASGGAPSMKFKPQSRVMSGGCSHPMGWNVKRPKM